MNVLSTPASQADLPPAAAAVLLVGSAGFLFANVTAQVLRAHFGAAAGLAVPGGGESWATAAYTLSSFAGVITAQPLEQRMGMRRYFVSGALMLAIFGWLQAVMPSQTALLSMRTFEGFASGSFGPRALLAAFLFCRSGRLPMTVTIAGFLALVVGVIAFVMLGASAHLLGWRGLFFVQFALGLLMAFAGLRWLPRRTRPVATDFAKATHASPMPRPVASRRRRRAQRHATTSSLRLPAA